MCIVGGWEAKRRRRFDLSPKKNRVLKAFVRQRCLVLSRGLAGGFLVDQAIDSLVV